MPLFTPLAPFFKQSAHSVIRILYARPVPYRIAFAVMGTSNVPDKRPVFAFIAIMTVIVYLWTLELLHSHIGPASCIF